MGADSKILCIIFFKYLRLIELMRTETVAVNRFQIIMLLKEHQDNKELSYEFNVHSLKRVRISQIIVLFTVWEKEQHNHHFDCINVYYFL